MNATNLKVSFSDRSFIFALLGAIIAGLLHAVFDPEWRTNTRHLVGTVLAGSAFALVWTQFTQWRELLLDSHQRLMEMQRLLTESQEKLRIAARRLEYQEPAMQLLKGSKRHWVVLDRMLESSIVAHCRDIPFVNPATYLDYLRTAIESSDRYHGVQRNTVRWFRDTGDGALYLRTLRERKMSRKVRIFVVDDRDAHQMRTDLIDSQLMDFYWDNTGRDVETFWITYSDLLDQLPTLYRLPDFAMYDDSLLVRYDEEHHILSFDVLNVPGSEHRIIELLDQQLRQGRHAPFAAVTPSPIPNQSFLPPVPPS